MSTVDDTKKKIGRPKVDTKAINLRLHVDQIKMIDDFRRQFDDLPTRPEAIRRLIRLGLKNRDTQ